MAGAKKLKEGTNIKGVKEEGQVNLTDRRKICKYPFGEISLGAARKLTRKIPSRWVSRDKEDAMPRVNLKRKEKEKEEEKKRRRRRRRGRRRKRNRQQ